MRTAVEAMGVWKRFRWREDRPRNLKESILGLSRRRNGGQEFWGLRDINISVAQGETLGLIGNNGSGKTTTLKLISGLMVPTRGSIRTADRVSTMLELGIGFQADFTGRENVYTGGIIAGLTRKEIHEAFPKIVEFAELEQHIDCPVRTYSTGMYMRLAFSLAIHIDAPILLIDEALAVGDRSFQSKCVDRLFQIKNEGTTILLVSHELKMIESLCDRVCWLENGRVRQIGDVGEIVAAYSSQERGAGGAPIGAQARSANRGQRKLVMGESRWGSLEVQIEAVKLRDESGIEKDTFEAGCRMSIDIKYRRYSAVREAIFQVGFSQENGVKCLDVNTWADGIPFRELDDRGCISLSIDHLHLSEGIYTIDVGVYSTDWAEIYDYHWRAYSFEVFSRSRHEWIKRAT
ncbi:MAG: ABC transporter ATP-binding protein [Chloroflexi bacterium]|nr:ABC transporter ATP-binding protein [Chloroflexota bacterium]